MTKHKRSGKVTAAILGSLASLQLSACDHSDCESRGDCGGYYGGSHMHIGTFFHSHGSFSHRPAIIRRGGFGYSSRRASS